MTQKYRIKGDNFRLPHVTRLEDVANEWKKAGYEVEKLE